jgi:hypothetical protein
MGGPRPAEIWLAAQEDQASVQTLTAELVRLPSRGGIDPYEPVLDLVSGWLVSRGLRCSPCCAEEDARRGTAVPVVTALSRR